MHRKALNCGRTGHIPRTADRLALQQGFPWVHGRRGGLACRLNLDHKKLPEDFSTSAGSNEESSCSFGKISLEAIWKMKLSSSRVDTGMRAKIRHGREEGFRNSAGKDGIGWEVLVTIRIWKKGRERKAKKDTSKDPSLGD